MKRRLTVMLLAVSVCIVGAYQSGLYPASGQTPTPTSTGPLGSIPGRVYVDVDANGAFGGPGVPLGFPIDLFNLDVGGLPVATANSASDGSYQFADLPAGNYNLAINLAIIACALPAGIPPFDWVGEITRLFLCGNPQFSTGQRDVVLGEGEALTDLDLPQLPTSYDISARVWLNATPLAAQIRVAVTAGGNACWNTQANTGPTLADH